MTTDILKTRSENFILDFIRKQLPFNKAEKHHERFEMSGYESTTGYCTISNLAIINSFAYLGIYDYTSYLFLDFYKGIPTLYLKYFYENENLEFEFNGYTTTEIILEMLKLTIFSNKQIRRRA